MLLGIVLSALQEERGKPKKTCLLSLMTAHRSPLGWVLHLDPGANPQVPEPQRIKGMRGQLSRVIPPGQALPHPAAWRPSLCLSDVWFPPCPPFSLFPFPPWEGEGEPRFLPLGILQTDRPPWLSIRWELARWWWLMYPPWCVPGKWQGGS